MKIMNEKEINLDITEKFKFFIENGEKYSLTGDELFHKHKDIIDNQLAKNIKAISKNMEKSGNHYVLSFSFGQIDLAFWEHIYTDHTLLTLYDEYQDEINFMTVDGRPFKIKELFHKDKVNEINNKTKRVCKKCGNTNRDIAIYCDQCGNEL